MELMDAIRQRRSGKKYDTAVQISDAELKLLFDAVILTPTSYNIQNWRFVVVRSPEQKERMCAAANNQPQVREASAVIVVVGRMDTCADLPRIVTEMPPEPGARLLAMVKKSYEGHPQLQRDEAIRTGSLAAMTLMLRATDMGFNTCALIGFKPEEVDKVAGLGVGDVPVMLITIGKLIGTMRPRAYRLPMSEVVRLETMDGKGLE